MVTSLVFRLIAKTGKKTRHENEYIILLRYWWTEIILRRRRRWEWADPNIACDQVDSLSCENWRRYSGIILTFFRSCSRCLLYSWVVHMKQLLYPKPTHSRFFLAPFFSWLKKTLGRQGTAMELHSTHSYIFHAILRFKSWMYTLPFSSFVFHTNSSSPINVIITNKEKKDTIFLRPSWSPSCAAVVLWFFWEGQQLTASLAGAADVCARQLNHQNKNWIESKANFLTISRLLRVLCGP